MREAQSLVDQGDMVGAIAAYQKAVEVAPNNVEAVGRIGHGRRKHRGFYQSQTHWQKALELNPEYLVALVHLGTINMKTQNFADAVNYFQQCMAKAAPEAWNIKPKIVRSNCTAVALLPE